MSKQMQHSIKVLKEFAGIVETDLPPYMCPDYDPLRDAVRAVTI